MKFTFFRVLMIIIDFIAITILLLIATAEKFQVVTVADPTKNIELSCHLPGEFIQNPEYQELTRRNFFTVLDLNIKVVHFGEIREDNMGNSICEETFGISFSKFRIWHGVWSEFPQRDFNIIFRNLDIGMEKCIKGLR